MPRLRTASSLLGKGSLTGRVSVCCDRCSGRSASCGRARPGCGGGWSCRPSCHSLDCGGQCLGRGQGKTPTVLAVAELLRSEFRSDEIFCLSRGYGGEFIGPVEVIPALHTAQLVGDEPLLLSAQFRTIVSRFRPSEPCSPIARSANHRDGRRAQNPNIRPDWPFW